MFQFFNLLPMLTAEENIVLPLSIAGEKPDRRGSTSCSREPGSAERRTHRPAELSGGEQQRVAIARALVTRPTILFADEPTGNLDSKTSGEILELLRGSVEDYGQTIVMVTHDAAGGRDRRPDPVPGRRPDRQGAGRGRAPAEVLEVMSTPAGMTPRSRLKGLLGPQAAGRADGDRDRARRGDGQRHLHPHRHDQVGVLDRVHAASTRTPTP